ncbi:MAG: hypothetical protein K6C97_07245 [Treponema sp.]|nr:hypothetical protein [Treponema sp.]
MTQKTQKNNKEVEAAWFAHKGPENDVVLSTRVRLVRNLADFPFPAKMNDEDRYRVNSLVYDAFSSMESFHYLDFKDLSQPGKEILKDKNILQNGEQSGGSSKDNREPSAIFFNYDDESLSCLVNESDHIKLSAFVSGLDCEKALEKIFKVDEKLQEKLQFAASIDFGYMTSHIKDCGTGMKISIRIFIPSIILSGQFDSLISLIQEKKLQIRPVFKPGNSDVSDFSNCLFDVSTSNSFEGSEFDQMALIQSVGILILKTERKIRAEFADNNPTVVLNFFKQNYAKAIYSLLLTYEESVSIVSAVKWGLHLGLISGVSDSELNALYFRAKSGHLKYLCDNFSFTFEDDIKKSENLQIKRLRTIVIQQAFEGIVNEKSLS